MSAAQKSLLGFGGNIQKANSKLATIGAGMTSLGSKLTTGVTLPLVGLGAIAVKTAAEFETGMSQVAATLGVPLSSIGELTEKAKEMGATTKFSATEAAEGLNILASAGYTTDQMMAALPYTLKLAAAGGLGLEEATNYATSALASLGLASSDSATLMANLEMVVDQMAKTAAASNTDVAQLGEAISVIGPTAQKLKGGITEVNTVLGLFSSYNIKGAEAGTHLRNIIAAMSPSTKKAKAAFKELGVQTYDSTGKLRSLKDIFADLSKAMEGMTDKEKTDIIKKIFKETDIGAVNALLGTTVETWEDLEQAIIDSGGAADQMAETQLDNLNGQLTILKSSLEGMAIAFGDILLPVIKKAVGFIQGITDKINNLSDSQKEVVVKVLAVAAAVGPVLLIVGKLATVISTIISVISGGGGLIASIGALAGPIGIIIAVVGALWLAWQTNFGHIQEYTQHIITKVQQMMTAFREMLGRAWEGLSALWEADFLGLRTIFTNLWAEIEQIFSDALRIIALVFQLFTKVFQGDWEGAWTALKAIFSQVWTTIKRTVITVLTSIRDFIANVITTIRDNWDSIWEGIKTAAFTVWNGIKYVVTEAADAIKSKVSTVMATIKEAWNAAWNTVSTKVNEVWTSITTKITEAIDSVKTKIDEDMSNVKTTWNDTWNGFVTTVTSIWENIKSTVIGAIAAVYTGVAFALFLIRSIWDTIWNALSTKVTEIWDAISTKVTEAIAAIKAAIDPYLAILKTAWDKVWNGVKETITTVWDAISTKITEVMTAVYAVVSEKIAAVQTTITNILIALRAIWDLAWDAIKSKIDTVWTAIKAAVSAAMTSVQTTITNILTSLRAIWDLAWNAIKTKVDEIWNAIKAAVETALNTIKSTVSSVMESLKSTFTEGWTAIKTTFTEGVAAALQVVTDAVEKFKAKGKAIVDGIKSGISGAWDAMVSWFKAKWDAFINSFQLPSWLGGGKGADAFGGSGAGRYASGLDYVPKDGFRAVLHEGERVLTAEEARAYNRDSGSSGGTQQFVFNSPKAFGPVESVRIYRNERRKEQLGLLGEKV